MGGYTHMETAIKLASISTSILLSAMEIADSCATPTGRSAGGWVRLAKIQGSAEAPYVIAVRRVDTARKLQFGCSCKDWIFRQRKKSNGNEVYLCKHQQFFFNQAASVPQQFWFFKAGHAFVLSVISQIVASYAALPIASHADDETGTKPKPAKKGKAA